jgi:hypothetical protein
MCGYTLQWREILSRALADTAGLLTPASDECLYSPRFNGPILVIGALLKL